jgi:WhiB family redox-sensing transcriptional regulator
VNSDSDELLSGDMSQYQHLEDGPPAEPFYMVPARPEWFTQAACTPADMHLFFPDTGGPDAYTAAKTICSTCPVVVRCRAYALTERLDDGCWGGTTPDERRHILRQRRKNIA